MAGRKSGSGKGGGTRKGTTTKKVGRDSRTGQFVDKDYVRRHPATTETETVRVPPRKKGK